MRVFLVSAIYKPTAMRYPFAYLLVFILCFTNCQKEELNDSKNLRELNFQRFTLTAPNNWKAFTQIGFDSQVGGITNGSDTLFYDYGWYSYKFDKETVATHYRQSRVLDNRPALLVIPKVQGQGIIGAYIEVDQINRLSLYSRSRNEDKLIKIIESVKF